MRNRHRTPISRLLVCGLMAIQFSHAPAARAQPSLVGDKPPLSEIESRLQSLRRSVENISDLKSILERYARFIEQYKDSPVSKEAERDAATWRDRLEKQMVKIGSRWVTPAEREGLKLHARTLADQAREALLKTRSQEAEALVHQAQEEDPANIVAAYLNGVLLFNQNQFVAAKKYFEQVAAAAPLEGPALNNLAVIQGRLSQAAFAMKLYAQAMTALPVNKEILHNVAEAINALPPGQRATPVAKNAIRLFETQQAQLAAKLAKDNLTPWGSTWVDKAMSVKLQSLEKDIDRRVAALSADYDKAQKSVDEIDGKVEFNSRQMSTMEMTSSSRDLKGNQIQRPLPARYFELQRQNEQLAQDRQALATQQADYREKAAKAVAEMPIQKYTATQRIFGAEGAPKQSTSATTRAATKPS